MRTFVISLVLIFSLSSQARLIEGAYSVKSTTSQSTWMSIKTWVKKKTKVIRAGIKKQYAPVSKTSEPHTKKRAEKISLLDQKIKQEQKKSEARVNELYSQLPKYSSTEANDSLTSVKSVKSQLSQYRPLKVNDKGTQGDLGLKKTKSGVPTFSLYSRKKIKAKSGRLRTIKIKVSILPRLNIGQEPQVSKNDMQISQLNIHSPNYKLAKKLQSKETVNRKLVKTWLKTKLKKIKNAKNIKFKDFGVAKVVTLKTIEAISPQLTPEASIDERGMLRLTKNERKMLSALILYSKGGQCHAVVGLFDELSNVPEFSREANFHLGACSHKMGFYSESTIRLVRVISSEDPYFSPKAIELVLQGLPIEYEPRIAAAIKGIKNKSLIPDGGLNRVHFILARTEAKKRNFKLAAKWAQKVQTKSEHYPKSLFILAVAQYAGGQPKTAIATLLKARQWMDKSSVNNTNLENLISTDLGRIYFQTGQYKLSHVEYLKVGKDHPLWVSALVEQGWTQLMLGDVSGAIGNMYSLHSPYFKAVFIPESYAVRSIGYINICQYGDAYQTLGLMEQNYKPWLKNIKAYIRKNKSSKSYYNTLKKYLAGKSSATVKGLPYQVIREMARKRNFLNHQDSLNQKADELAQFRFISSYIKKDKYKTKRKMGRARKSIATLKAKIKSARTHKTDEKLALVKSWKKLKAIKIRAYNEARFKLSVLENSKKGFNQLKKRVSKRLNKEKSKLRSIASYALKTNMKLIAKHMSRVVENNEFLRYEVFAGSGENIRYLSAGGRTSGANRLPSSIKPKQTLTWSVTGEYWEDEIGSYRSALKNNCPKKKYAIPKSAKN